MTFPSALQSLRDRAVWCVWKPERINGRLTKVPYQSHGSKARSDDPATWREYDKLPHGNGFAGPGLMLGDGRQGVDLDVCITDDGALEPWAAEIVERLDSYTEISPSCRGLKIFFTGPEGRSSEVGFGKPVEIAPGELKRREIAYFTGGRYFTMTGSVWRDRPLRQISQHDADWLRQTIEARRRDEMQSKAGTKQGNLRGIIGDAELDGLPEVLQALIRQGAPEGERSERFHHAVCWLADLGRGAAAIVALLERHPHGIAAKYVGRISAEVERCLCKRQADAQSKPKNDTKNTGTDCHLIDGAAFLRLVTPPVYVARPPIQRGQVIAETGRTNHGKTTVAHLFIVGVLTGRAIGALRFKKGRVLLLVGENPGNSALQLLAAVRRYGVTADDLANLTVRPAPGRLADVAAELTAAVRTEHLLVVIDTSTAFFSYDDENDNVLLHAHAQDAAGLSKLPGNPAVLILCHPVKGATQENLQPRGGGAFLNAIDANLTVWNDGETVTLHHTKMRGPTFEPIAFRLEPQDVGVKDDEGVPLVPLVAVPLSEDEEARLARQAREEQNRLLYAMLAHPTASIADWAEACGWSYAGAPAKSKVYRALKELTDDRLVRKYRRRYVLTESGRKEAEKIT